MKKVLPIFICFLIGALFSCGDNQGNEPGENEDDFDRKVMLTDMADGIIVPAFEDYVAKIEIVNSFSNSFIVNPNEDDLNLLRNHWLVAYTSWQYVSMFNIGKAEEINLRNFTNIYPANVAEIEENITSGSYNLELPSTNDEQGFPALDFLLYGIADDDASIVSKFMEPSYANYLVALTERMVSMGNEVLSDWKDGYRDEFISNDGATATSSVNKIVNDYLFYYEKLVHS